MPAQTAPRHDPAVVDDLAQLLAVEAPGRDPDAVAALVLDRLVERGWTPTPTVCHCTPDDRTGSGRGVQATAHGSVRPPK